MELQYFFNAVLTTFTLLHAVAATNTGFFFGGVHDHCVRDTQWIVLGQHLTIDFFRGTETRFHRCAKLGRDTSTACLKTQILGSATLLLALLHDGDGTARSEC